MRKIMFFLFVVINLIKSFYYLAVIKIVEKKGNKERTTEVFNKYGMKIIKSINRSLRMDIQVEGHENIPDEACLFASNHQGNFDPLVIMEAIGYPVGFVAKKELKKLIYIRSWFTRGNCVFIDRTNPREGLKAINLAADTIKDGNSMAIFPEGTRSKSENVAAFKKGSLKVAIKSKAKIVPVALTGVYNAYEKSKGYKKVPVKVTFGKPIDTAELTKEERVALTDNVRDIVVSMKK